MTEVVTVEPVEERPVALAASSREKLLYDLITELIYHKDIDAFLASDASFIVSHDGEWKLTGMLRGCSLHGQQLADVKAMTYHDLKIDEQRGKTMITFTVDL